MRAGSFSADLRPILNRAFLGAIFASIGCGSLDSFSSTISGPGDGTSGGATKSFARASTCCAGGVTDTLGIDSSTRLSSSFLVIGVGVFSGDFRLNLSHDFFGTPFASVGGTLNSSSSTISGPGDGTSGGATKSFARASTGCGGGVVTWGIAVGGGVASGALGTIGGVLGCGVTAGGCQPRRAAPGLSNAGVGVGVAICARRFTGATSTGVTVEPPLRTVKPALG